MTHAISQYIEIIDEIHKLREKKIHKFKSMLKKKVFRTVDAVMKTSLIEKRSSLHYCCAYMLKWQNSWCHSETSTQPKCNLMQQRGYIEHEIHSCWNHLFLIILRYTFHFSSLIKWFLIINFSPATCSMFKCSNFNVHNRIYCTCSIPFVAIRGKSGVEIWQQRILTLKQESIRRFEYGWGISVNEFKNIRELFWRSNFSSLRHT